MSRTITPTREFAVAKRHPGWFNSSAVSVLLPHSNKQAPTANRRERRASMKGAQR